MKLCIHFTDLDEPRLARTEFYPPGGDGRSAYLTFSSAEAKIAGASAEQTLKWTRGVQALCLALLRWKSAGQTRLADRSGLARCLWEPVRKAHEGDPNWLLAVFGEKRHITSLLTPSGGSGDVVAVSLTSLCQKGLALTVTAGLPNYPDEIRELTADACAALADHMETLLQMKSAAPQRRTSAVPAARDEEEDEEAAGDIALARVRLLVQRAGLANFVDAAATVPAHGPVLPLRHDDRVRLHARASRPAHAVFLWIDSQAAVTPLHPWRGFSWEHPTALPAQSLSAWELPEATGEGWVINTPAGAETLAMLMRREPFSPAQLAAIRHAFSSMQLPMPDARDVPGAGPLTFCATRGGPSAGSSAPQAGLRLGPSSPVTRHPFEPLQRALAAPLQALDLDCLCLISLPNASSL